MDPTDAKEIAEAGYALAHSGDLLMRTGRSRACGAQRQVLRHKLNRAIQLLRANECDDAAREFEVALLEILTEFAAAGGLKD